MALQTPLTKDIEETLEHILKSAPFRTSSQQQQLLNYLVQESRKDDSVVKERIIGIEVFGRRPDYDTADDPVVRSRVNQLRKRLSLFYSSAEAGDCNVRIQIPNGQYRAEFLTLSKQAVQPTPPVDAFDLAVTHEINELNPQSHPRNLLNEQKAHAETEAGAKQQKFTVASSRSPGAIKIPVFAVVSLIVAGVAIVIWAHRKSAIEQFWAPIVASERQVLIYPGAVPLYVPKTAVDAPLQPDHDAPASMDSAIPEAIDTNAPGTEWVSKHQGVSPPGDVQAGLQIANLLGSMHRTVTLRTSGELPYVDVQNAPLVLIGAYDNYWTLRLTKDMPLYFDKGNGIRERDGVRRSWTATARADENITDDYALVFRLARSDEHGPVIGIAGLTTCGTRAAAGMVTDPDKVRFLFPDKMSALKANNVEMAVHTKLLNCVPTSVDVVASRTW